MISPLLARKVEAILTVMTQDHELRMSHGILPGPSSPVAETWSSAQTGDVNWNSEHVALAVDPEGSAPAVWSQGTPLRVWASQLE